MVVVLCKCGHARVRVCAMCEHMGLVGVRAPAYARVQVCCCAGMQACGRVGMRLYAILTMTATVTMTVTMTMSVTLAVTVTMTMTVTVTRNV